MSRSLPWRDVVAPPVQSWRWLIRCVAAAALRSASRKLADAARRIADVPQHALPAMDPGVVEFHADGGAPEGAIYVDGELAFHLPGVTRL